MKKSPDKKQDIICAAIQIFATTGYAASNVPSIAKGARVSVGSIYHYFDNKQAILNVAFQDVLNQFLDSICNSIQQESETKSIFDRLFNITIELIDDNTTAMHFIYQNIFNVDLNTESKDLRSKVISTLTEFLEAGQKDGTFIKAGVQSQIALLTGSLSMMANFSWIGENVETAVSPDSSTILDLKNQVWNGLIGENKTFNS